MKHFSIPCLTIELPMFDTAAQTYTAASTVQQQLCDAVLPTYPDTPPTHLIDLGCGTGVNTLKLHERYPTTTITGVDQSVAMIQEAQTHPTGIAWTVDDAERYTHPEPVDFISSHGCLHWVNSPIAPIIKRNLAPNGRFNLHMFGPDTYAELNQALHFAWPEHPPIPATQFRTADDYTHDLDPWGPLTVAHTRILVAHKSLTDLLKTIAHTGTALATRRRVWTPRRLAQVEATYRDYFGSIWATYSLISIRNYD